MEDGPEPQPKNPSRRQFLKDAATKTAGALAAAAGLGAATAGCDAPPQPVTDYRLRTGLETAQESGTNYVFSPEGELSQELFLQARKSVFCIYGFSQDGSQYLGQGTGFCVGLDKGTRSAFIATNKHVADAFVGSGRLELKQADNPNTHTAQITTSISSEDRDMALMKLTFSATTNIHEIPILTFRDNENLEPGTRGIVVGYPGSYSAYGQEITTYGSVATRSTALSKDGNLLFEGSAQGGCSGSPLVIPDRQGRPVATGIAMGGGDFLGAIPVTGIVPLDVVNLYKKIS